MPEVIFPLDSAKKFEDQVKVGHNRWHPEIPPVATVKPGDSFRVDCREWFDGAIVNDDSADDILNAPLKTVHKLAVPGRGCEAGRPADRRHPGRRSDSPGGLRSTGRAGLGVYRHLRQEQRRRIPDRCVPGRVQGDLGFPGADRDIASHSRGFVRWIDPSWSDGDGAIGRVVGPLELT